MNLADHQRHDYDEPGVLRSSTCFSRHIESKSDDQYYWYGELHLHSDVNADMMGKFSFSLPAIVKVARESIKVVQVLRLQLDVFHFDLFHSRHLPPRFLKSPALGFCFFRVNTVSFSVHYSDPPPRIRRVSLSPRRIPPQQPSWPTLQNLLQMLPQNLRTMCRPILRLRQDKLPSSRLQIPALEARLAIPGL